MFETQSDNREQLQLQQVIAPLLGQSAWRVRLGWGSFVTFEFGKHVIQHGYEHGEWHLWIYMSAWYLETANELLTACEDTRENMQRQLNLLEGVPLRSVTVLEPSLETLLSFDKNLTLRIFPTYSDNDYDSWILFDPTGNVLVIRSSGQWSYHDANLPD